MISVKHLKDMFKRMCNVDLECYTKVLDKNGKLLYVIKLSDDDKMNLKN